MASPTSSSAIAQIRALCEAYPTARKIVFVPRMQIGQTIESAVARRGDGSAGLACLLPRHYAERLAARRILASGRAELQSAHRRFLAAHLTDSLDGAVFADLPGPAHFAGSVAEAVGTLRADGASAERVLAATEGDSASPALGVIARCYAAYEDALDEEQLYDEADVLRWGAEALADGPRPETTDSVFAVLGDAELSVLESALLHDLSAASRAFYRIGEPDSGSKAPATFAAARFAEAPAPEAPDVSGNCVESTRRAVGAENEVRAALRAILAADAPLDDVEIAFAQSQPYQGLIADVADAASLDASFSTGRPALQTRTGQALRGLYNWIRDDFDPALLIEMLRSGLLRIDRVLDDLDASEVWSGPALATWLAGRRYEPGRAGYERALSVAEEDLKREIERLDGKKLDTEREREQLGRTRLARQILTVLFDLIPDGKTTVSAMVRMSRRFLERFGPVDASGGVPEEKRSLEEAARRVLYQKLGGLRDLPVAYEAPVRRLARMIEDALERQYVRSERPRAGAVHVVPLERAAFSGRRQLYVVGLGSEAFAAPETDDGLYQELNQELENYTPESDADGAFPFSERREFAFGDTARRQQPHAIRNMQHADKAKKLDQASADSSAKHVTETVGWLARRALRRHAGPVHLFASIYDIDESEERFPAALFLEAEEELERDTPPASFLPNAAGAPRLPVDERAAWLASRANGEDDPTSPTAREAACERYPWLDAVREARAARSSEAYTEHDGLLDAGPFPELDFTADGYDGLPLSPSRLETFAETPYLYFLQYVLGVRPLDEPALDDVAWLDPLRRGDILHATFDRFMKGRDGGPVRLDEEAALLDALHEAFDAAKRRLAPPNDRVEATALRRLKADARVFLRTEAQRGATPWGHERGFGYGPRREREGDLDEAEIAFDDDLAVRLRGRIDRIDEGEAGGLAVWDYKTGSAGPYDESEPLSDGAHLQWALYAYALETLTGRPVDASGYFFTSTKEMGTRLSAAPAPYRAEVGKIITRLGELARAGCFPMNPKAKKLNDWKYRGYEKLFPDLDERSGELKLKAKSYPEEKPTPLFL
jgi:RecB family exonuclease